MEEGKGLPKTGLLNACTSVSRSKFTTDLAVCCLIREGWGEMKRVNLTRAGGRGYCNLMPADFSKCCLLRLKKGFFSCTDLTGFDRTFGNTFPNVYKCTLILNQLVLVKVEPTQN